MRILVTGGRGYLGGRIAKAFLELGHQVTITTRNLNEGLKNISNLKITSPDWNSERELIEICRNIDFVFHTAGINAADCELDPKFAHEFNGNATGRLVSAAEKTGVGTFVYLSTAHVYAQPLSGYIDENTVTSNPHPYATSHLLGENNVIEGSGTSDSGLRKHVIRLSNVYGAPSSVNASCWNLFINNIAKQATVSKTISIQNNPYQLRDFIAISNFINLIIGITQIDQKEEFPNLVNFGSGNAMSLIKVAHKVSIQANEILGHTPNVIHDEIESIDKNLELNFSTNYGSILDLYKTASMEDEIKRLLQFTKDNFSGGL